MIWAKVLSSRSTNAGRVSADTSTDVSAVDVLFVLNAMSTAASARCTSSDPESHRSRELIGSAVITVADVWGGMTLFLRTRGQGHDLIDELFATAERCFEIATKQFRQPSASPRGNGLTNNVVIVDANVDTKTGTHPLGRFYLDVDLVASVPSFRTEPGHRERRHTSVRTIEPKILTAGPPRCNRNQLSADTIQFIHIPHREMNVAIDTERLERRVRQKLLKDSSDEVTKAYVWSAGGVDSKAVIRGLQIQPVSRERRDLSVNDLHAGAALGLGRQEVVQHEPRWREDRWVERAEHDDADMTDLRVDPHNATLRFHPARESTRLHTGRRPPQPLGREYTAHPRGLHLRESPRRRPTTARSDSADRGT